MPTWWIATEFVATFAGGIALVVLDRLTVDRTGQEQASLDD
jgi:predicted cobalt transporter CbtA